MTGSLHLAALVFLLGASAFFSASETALFSLNFLRVRHLQSQGDRRGNQVARLVLRPKELIITILMGNELVNIAASSLAGVYFIGVFGPRGQWYAIGVMTVVILVLGEMIPKTLAVRYPLGFSLRAAPIVGAFSRLTAGPNWVIRRLTGGIVAVLGAGKEADLITEDEFKGLVREGRKIGVLDRDEEDIIYNILEMGDLAVSGLMVPRTEMVVLEETTAIGAALDELRSESPSRIPVYRGSIDNITGILYLKDVLSARARGTLRAGERVTALARAPYLVPESMRADELMVQFKNRRVQIAVVVDEYGGTAGVITMDDLLRQLFENLSRGTVPELDLSRELSEGVYAVSGRMPVEEFNRRFGTHFSGEDFHTIGGILLDLFGRLPRRGDVLRWGNLRFRVTAVEERRIISVRVELVKEETPR